MIQHFRLKRVLFLIIFFSLSCHNREGSNTGEANPDKPNIILIMADDQGWGDVGYNDNSVIITPNLDKMSREGIRFDRFYAAAPVCSPTRGSCITGRHPYRYGIYFANVGSMKPGEITLAEALKTAGYKTGHFGKWHLGTLTNDEIDANRGGRDPAVYAPPWENGFDVCFSTESKVPTWDPMITPGKDAGDIGNRIPGEPFGTAYWTGPGKKVSENLEGDDSRIIMDRVIPFIRTCVEEKNPFLSIIWFHAPHLPAVAGEKYKQMYASCDEDIQNFYGIITAMDEQIGRLRNELNDLGITQNTVIFYTSDNGPEGADRTGRTQGSTNGLKGRKRSLHEGGIRVPGIMIWPAHIKENQRINIPVCTSDYYPTIMEIADLEIPGQPVVDGISLLPLLNGSLEGRPVPIGFQSRKQRAMIDNRYKIYSSDDGKTFELYDLWNDPYESKDVSATFPGKKDSLIAELFRWMDSCKKSGTGHDYN